MATTGKKWGKVRTGLKMLQATFWARIGITQSGGSRYEQGRRPVPQPVELLLRVAYGTAAERHAALKQLIPTKK